MLWGNIYELKDNASNLKSNEFLNETQAKNIEFMLKEIEGMSRDIERRPGANKSE
jgi:hypothetical protein